MKTRASYFVNDYSYISWWDKSFSNRINKNSTLCINQLFLLGTFYFIFLQTFLLIDSVSDFWDLNSWIFCATFYLSSKFLIFATFWMLWMLVIMNEVKHMILHGSHVWQMKSLKPLVTQTFLVSLVKWIRSWSHFSWITNH